MFRTPQLLLIAFALIVCGAAYAAPAPGGVVETRELQPFAQVAYVPAHADLSSIRIEGVKAVEVNTILRSVTDARYCNQSPAEPGGSMLCSQTRDMAPVPAYEVTLSYVGPPMASDEYESTRFTLSVYFRPEQVSPALRQALSSGGKIGRASLAEFFQLTVFADPVEQLMVDEANSRFCAGSYVDGNWIRTKPNCQDRLAYQKRTVVSPYLRIEVAAASAQREQSMPAGGL